MLVVAEPGIAVVAVADDAGAGCADSSWVHQSAAVSLVEGDGAACVGCGDVIVEVVAGVAAGAVRVEENTAVGPAGPGDEDMQVGPWAEARQGWFGGGIVAGSQRWVDMDCNQAGPVAGGVLGR